MGRTAIQSPRRAKPGRAKPKRGIAAGLIAFLGEEVIRRLLDDVKPGWDYDLRAVRDRHLSHTANGSEAARNVSLENQLP